MLPHNLTLGLEHLRQPRLLKPICENMLGTSGLPQASLLQGIDGLFCEDAVSQVLAWEMPPNLPFGTNPDDRWKTVSSLQKAIRFGDVHSAMVAAHAAYGMDPRHLLRRLVVCALEDVCLGNLYAVGTALALAGDKASRDLAGDQKTMVWLAAQLASGWKDRTACNLCTIVCHDLSLQEAISSWANLPDEDLSEKATEMERPVGERMLAAWLLAGTKRYGGRNLPAYNGRPRWALMRLMVQSGMPLLFYWLADRAAMRGGGAMFVALLPIWQALRDSDEETLVLRTNKIPDRPLIGGLLAQAYDMYTREGQKALRKFGWIPEIARVLGDIPIPENRIPALFHAVFILEGSILNLRVSLPEIDRIHFESVRVEIGGFGLPRVADQQNLFRLISEHLGELHQARVRAVQQPPSETDFQAHTAAKVAQPSITPVQGELAVHEAYKPTNASSLRQIPDVDLTDSIGWPKPA